MSFLAGLTVPFPHLETSDSQLSPAKEFGSNPTKAWSRRYFLPHELQASLPNEQAKGIWYTIPRSRKHSLSLETYTPLFGHLKVNLLKNFFTFIYLHDTSVSYLYSVHSGSLSPSPSVPPSLVSSCPLKVLITSFDLSRLTSIPFLNFSSVLGSGHSCREPQSYFSFLQASVKLLFSGGSD